MGAHRAALNGTTVLPGSYSFLCLEGCMGSADTHRAAYLLWHPLNRAMGASPTLDHAIVGNSAEMWSGPHSQEGKK